MDIDIQKVAWLELIAATDIDTYEQSLNHLLRDLFKINFRSFIIRMMWLMKNYCSDSLTRTLKNIKLIKEMWIFKMKMIIA